MNALVLAVALFAGAENPYLAEAKTLATNLEFERCLERLKQAQSQWKSTPGELRDIELWNGLCHLNLGHRAISIEHFRTALRIDEATELPPWSSPKTVELFAQVRRSLKQPAEPMPDVDLPASAPPRVDLAPRQKPTPIVERAPATFAWKRRGPPLVLAVVAVIAAGTAVGLGVNAKSLEQKANGAHYESDFVSLGHSAQASATGATVGWAIAATALTGAAITFFVLPE